MIRDAVVRRVAEALAYPVSLLFSVSLILLGVILVVTSRK